MSWPPPDESQITVQMAEMRPTDKNDPASLWTRFVDAIRQSVGLKPLFLTERWAVARVRQKEADAEARVLAAKAQYESTMAQVRACDLKAQGELAKNVATADLTRAHAAAIDTVSQHLVHQLQDSKGQDPAEVIENFLAVISRIRMHGETVEIDTHDKTDRLSDNGAAKT